MAASSFLTKLIGNVWVAVIILIICALASIYYFFLPADSIINILGTKFTPEVSRTLIIIFVFALGLIINFSINLITGHIQKETPIKEVPKETQVIIPPIEIKHIYPPQPETKAADTTAHANHKFYPNHFLPDLKFFVGRTEVLQKIKEALDTDHRAAIHDISGLGKTFTTYKFAEVNKDNYDKIFFIRATKEEMMESLAKCGEMVNAQLASLEEQKGKALGFKQWLEESENWLVIYDNVEEPAELFPFVPVNKKGDCIFTSNFREVTELGTEIDINKLSPADAEILLYSRANNKPHTIPDLQRKEKAAFDDLIREIDGLPLTLNSTGAFIYKKDWTFEKFWQKYENELKIVWESEDNYSHYQRKSAGIVFSLAYEELSADPKVGKAVRTLLNAMSFLSPDEIPEDLLQEILRESDEAFADLKNDDDVWDDVRRGLTGYDLLKYNKDKCIFTTHRAIQRVIQTKLAIEEIKNVCVKLSKILSILFPEYDHFNRPACEKYSQHVQIFLENSAKLQNETQEISILYFRAARYQELLTNHARAEQFYKRTLDISGKVSGKQSLDYGIDLNNLASNYLFQHRYDEAIEALEEAVKILNAVLNDKDNIKISKILINLGEAYYSKTNFDKAIEKLEESLRITEKINQKDRDYASLLNSLGKVYRAKNRNKEAIEKYKEALLIDEKTIGTEHPDYATTLSNLAVAYENEHKYIEALNLHEQALQIYENRLIKGHPFLLQSKRAVERCRNQITLAS
jgi:tetratricopeptide (TPR) repeat protein